MTGAARSKVRRWQLLACAGLLALLAAAPPAHAQDPDDLVIRNFSVDLTIEESGTLLVSETIEVDFLDEHHGILRTIPTAYPLSEDDTQVELPEDREAADFNRIVEIRDVTATSTAPDDVEVTEEGGGVTIRIGDPDVEVSGPHTYEITYSVRGALNRYSERSELIWNVTGNEWENVIESASGVVTAPEILEVDCASGPSGSTDPCDEAEVTDGRGTFSTGRLDPGEGLTISVSLPLGAVDVPPPLIRERWRLSTALAGDAQAWPLAGLTTLLGAAGVVLLARRRRQRIRSLTVDAGVQMSGQMLRGDPPQGLRPAQVRMLTEERVDATSLGATLLDLAARGHLEIETDGDSDDDDASGYRFRRVPGAPDGDLLSFERALLDGLFRDGGTITAEEIAEEHEEERTRFEEQVRADAMERGWFLGKPNELRTGRALVGFGLVLLAVLVLILALVLTRVGVAALPLLVAAVIAAVLIYRMPTRTPEGKRLLAEARGYEQYMSSTDGGLPTDGRGPAEVFGTTLPYAMAMGVAPRWVRRFKATGAPATQWVPAYYLPLMLASDNDPDRFATSVASFGDAVTPAPSSSSSGTSVSSGGGFGGGGGGGW